MVGGGPARRGAQRDVSSGSEEAEKFPAVVPAELVHYLSSRRSTAPKRLSICVSTGSRYELCTGGTEGHCAILSNRKSVCQHRGRDRNCELRASQRHCARLGRDRRGGLSPRSPGKPINLRVNTQSRTALENQYYSCSQYSFPSHWLTVWTQCALHTDIK